MQNGKCEHGSRWVKVTEKWWKVVLAPDCECEEPETLFDLVGEGDLDRDCDDIDEQLAAYDAMYGDGVCDGYADDAYEDQVYHVCGQRHPFGICDCEDNE